MNDDVITYLDEDEIKKEEPKEKPDVIINDEFINGLPDWDLVPPYEVIKRSNL